MKFRTVLFHILLAVVVVYLSYVSATVATTKSLGAGIDLVSLERRIGEAESRMEVLEGEVLNFSGRASLSIHELYDLTNSLTSAVKTISEGGSVEVGFEEGKPRFVLEEVDEIWADVSNLEMAIGGVLEWLKVLGDTICDSGLSELSESEFCVEFH